MTVPEIYKAAHNRLPARIRALPTSDPEYQEALRQAVQAITRELALERR